jgi:hypothetical protein
MSVPRLLPAACLVAALLAAGPGRAEEEARERPLSAVLSGLGAPRPATRRAALARLEALVARGTDPGAQAVRPLADVLRRRPADEAARAVALLARLDDSRARRLWLDALDPALDPRVFGAAVDAAAFRRGDADAMKALLQAARDGASGEAARWALVLEALGASGCPAAGLILTRPLPAEGWLPAAGRALGLARLGGRASGEALVVLLGHPHAAVRVHAWEGLVALTRETLPVDQGVWQAWFASHPDALRGACAPPAPAPAEGDRYAEPPPVHVPHYYGIPIDRPRSRVVFCLDVSQSMWGHGIDHARAELGRALEAFPTTYAFEVIAFNERLLPFAGALLPAHPVVKARALAWLDALETISYTNLYDAVETAFGHAGIGERVADATGRLDAVFLLSDGAPNRGRYRRDDRVVAGIAALSRRRIPVHTIGAGEEVFPLLRRIADATGGRFADAFDFE